MFEFIHCSDKRNLSNFCLLYYEGKVKALFKLNADVDPGYLRSLLKWSTFKLGKGIWSCNVHVA